MKRIYTNWREAIAGSIAALAALMLIAAATAPAALAQQATPVPSGGSPLPEWPLYGATIDGARNAQNSFIDTGNAGTLAQAWSATVGGPVSGTPVVALGLVFVGSYDGTLYAFNEATGANVWTYATGANVTEPNLNIPLGIEGSAAVANGVVYVGDAAGTVHALDALTGTLLWKTQVDDQTAASIWSSPVVWNGHVYVGVASISKEEGFRGNVVALDAATGEVAWKTYMVPENADGAGVFDVPAIDPVRGLVIVGTQNAYTASPAPFGNPISVVALDAATGETRWVFNAPPGGADLATAPTDDVGFSASPNLFTASIDGTSRDLVGIGQKSGVFWALDRETGAVVWQTEVTPAGPLGGMEGTSAVAGTFIAVPGTDWPDPAGPAAGEVTVLDTATGTVVWSTNLNAPAASPVAISNGVVFQAGLDGILHAYALADGTELFAADLGASVSGGIAVAGDTVVLGAATPAFAPFVRPGNTVVAFRLTSGATPVASPAATPVA